jgi:hypothetical protein
VRLAKFPDFGNEAADSDEGVEDQQPFFWQDCPAQDS